MEEIGNSLHFISDELIKVAKQQAMLLDLMAEVKQFKKLIPEQRSINNKILSACADTMENFHLDD